MYAEPVLGPSRESSGFQPIYYKNTFGHKFPDASFGLVVRSIGCKLPSSQPGFTNLSEGDHFFKFASSQKFPRTGSACMGKKAAVGQ